MTGPAHRQDICELLPLYAAGTLAREAERLVRVHLEDCERCARDVVVLRAACDEMNRAPVPLVPEPDFENFRRRLSAEAARSGSGRSERPATADSPLAWLAAAAAVLALSAALWFSSSPAVRGPAVYETATSSAPAVVERFVLEVELTPGTPMSVARRLLREAGAAAVSEIGPGRLEAVFPATSDAFEDIEAARRDMLAYDEVRDVRLQSVVGA